MSRFLKEAVLERCFFRMLCRPNNKSDLLVFTSTSFRHEFHTCVKLIALWTWDFTWYTGDQRLRLTPLCRKQVDQSFGV